MVGAPPCPECPVHIHLPYPPDPDSATQESALFSQFAARPCQRQIVRPTHFCFFPSCHGNSGCFDCLREARTIREGGRRSGERSPLLTPAGSHPAQSATLPPQLITPGKPPPVPGEPDHFARPNGRHSLWVFKAQLLTVSGWRAARWENPAGQRPSTWLSSSTARSSTCSPMATAGLVDGSRPPRS